MVEVVRLIRSHKTVNDGRHNRLAKHGSPKQAYPHVGFRPFQRLVLPLSTGLWEDSRWAEFELATFMVLWERI